MKASKVVNIILVILTGVIFLTPVLLRCPLFESGISSLLMTLKIPEYKSAYLGLIGSLVGSWTAITGAIWVQQEIEKANNLQKKKNITMNTMSCITLAKKAYIQQAIVFILQ